MKTQKLSTNAAVQFGEFIKARRKGIGKTGRITALEAGMQPSNYCRLEYGALKPPLARDKLERLADAVGLPKDSPERHEFYNLAAKATDSVPLDLADIITRNDAVPLMLRTLGKKKLAKADIDRIVELVRGRKD